MSKIIYASFIRFPAEKAHALYVAKVCESFAAAGYQTTLLVPRRLGVSKTGYRSYYNLKHDFSVARLLCLDLLWLPFGKTLAHKIGLLSFGVSVLAHLIGGRSNDVSLFTNDALVAWLASFSRVRVIYEVHDYPRGGWWLYRAVGKRVHKIQTNTKNKIDLVMRDFKVSKEKVYCAFNGVTIEDFDIAVSKNQARQKLGMDLRKQYVVYTGHLYNWKGVDILAESARRISEVEILIVGGTSEDVSRMKEKYRTYPNLTFLGHQPHAVIPYYLKAADVLVLPNSGKFDVSLYHTSPMKLFEYIASGTPIVASDLPSIREILNEQNAILCTPDDPGLLAESIQTCLTQPEKAQERSRRVFQVVQQFTWRRRIKAIVQQIS